MRCSCNCGNANDGCAFADAGGPGKHCYRPQNGCTRTAVA